MIDSPDQTSGPFQTPDPKPLPDWRFLAQVEPMGAIQPEPFASRTTGGFALPHVTTFMGLTTALSRTYLPSDEALQHSRSNARHMLNDLQILEPLADPAADQFPPEVQP